MPGGNIHELHSIFIMTDNIKMTVIRFGNQMRQNELPLFRGAVIRSLPNDNVLFHNHDGDSLRYAYPLIQYKLLDGRAAIVCIGEGSDAIREYFSNYSSDIVLGTRTARLVIDSISETFAQAGVSGSVSEYRIRRWLPLNRENYILYQESASLAERCGMLEKILIGNILSFGKGIGVDMAEEIRCELTDIRRQYLVRYKGVGLSAFDLSFRSNAVLPDFIGLGKGVSIGHGVIAHCR